MGSSCWIQVFLDRSLKWAVCVRNLRCRPIWYNIRFFADIWYQISDRTPLVMSISGATFSTWSQEKMKSVYSAEHHHICKIKLAASGYQVIGCVELLQYMIFYVAYRHFSTADETQKQLKKHWFQRLHRTWPKISKHICESPVYILNFVPHTQRIETTFVFQFSALVWFTDWTLFW